MMMMINNLYIMYCIYIYKLSLINTVSRQWTRRKGNGLPAGAKILLFDTQLR
jgi:hypothetical protein